jgi:two-component system NtrC family response regulator
LELPPLRNRVEDIGLLAEYFLRTEAAEQDRLLRSLSVKTKSKLAQSYFPGNVRQLRNEMRRLALMGEGEVQWEELDQAIVDVPRESGTGALLEQQVQELERKAIAGMMDQMRGNRTRTAEALGLTRYSLNRKLQKYGLEPKG